MFHIALNQRINSGCAVIELLLIVNNMTYYVLSLPFYFKLDTYNERQTSTVRAYPQIPD